MGESTKKPKGYFRLILVSVDPFWKLPWLVGNAIHCELGPMIKELGWWTVLCGLDIWVGKVPIVRTLILANVTAWILLYLRLR